ncbi:unnamed protein product, partial [Prorocentrum cordatum]
DPEDSSIAENGNGAVAAKWGLGGTMVTLVTPDAAHGAAGVEHPRRWPLKQALVVPDETGPPGVSGSERGELGTLPGLGAQESMDLVLEAADAARHGGRRRLGLDGSAGPGRQTDSIYESVSVQCHTDQGCICEPTTDTAKLPDMPNEISVRRGHVAATSDNQGMLADKHAWAEDKLAAHNDRFDVLETEATNAKEKAEEAKKRCQAVLHFIKVIPGMSP